MRDVIKFLKKIFMKPTETENTKAMKNAYKQALYSLKNIPTEQIKERYLPELVFKTLEFLVQYFDEHPDRVSTDTERNLLKDLREQLTEYRHNQVNILDILEKLKSNLAKIEPGFFNRGYVYPTFDLTLALPSFHTQNLMKKMVKALGQKIANLEIETEKLNKNRINSVRGKRSVDYAGSEVSENLFSGNSDTNRKQEQTDAKEEGQATEKNASSVASKGKPKDTQQEENKKSKVVSTIAYVPSTSRNRREKTKQQEQSNVTNMKQAGLFKRFGSQSQQEEQSAPNPSSPR